MNPSILEAYDLRVYLGGDGETYVPSPLIVYEQYK